METIFDHNVSDEEFKTPNDIHKFFEVLNVDYGGYKYFKEDYGAKL